MIFGPWVAVLSVLLEVSSVLCHYDIDDSILHKITFSAKLPDSTEKETIPNLERELYDLRSLPDEDFETVTMTTRYNERYSCTLPRVGRNKDGDSEYYSGLSALELLKPLFDSKTCSIRLEPYWTYELCHGQHLRQYHQEGVGSDIKVTQYFLGKYDENKFEADVAALRSQAKGKKPRRKKVDAITMPYLEVIMGDGTVCDINGLPRQTRVHYACHPSRMNELFSFKEISTCVYEAMILSPALCAHPDFRAESSTEQNIRCRPLNDLAASKPLDLIRQETENLRVLTKKQTYEGHFTRDSSGSIKLQIRPIASLGTSEEVLGDERSVPSPEEDLEAEVPAFKPLSDPVVVREFLLGRHCLYGGAGWWKYEFCYGKVVRQYHEEDGRQVSEIKLGTFDEEKHKKWIEENPSKAPKTPVERRKVVSHFYSDGDFCDEVKKPREIEVKLKCVKSDSLSSVSLYLLEPRTCQYVLGVESLLICDIVPRADEYGLMDVTFDDLDVGDTLKNGQARKEEEEVTKIVKKFIGKDERIIDSISRDIIDTATTTNRDASSSDLKKLIALPVEKPLQIFILKFKSRELLKVLNEEDADGAVSEWVAGVRAEFDDLVDAAGGDVESVLSGNFVKKDSKMSWTDEELGLALDYGDDDDGDDMDDDFQD